MKKTEGDKFGYKQGAKGFAAPDKTDLEFIRGSKSPKSDHVIYGEKAVGWRATVGSGKKLQQEK